METEEIKQAKRAYYIPPFKRKEDVAVTVYVKNLAKGLVGNTYNIYAQGCPSLRNSNIAFYQRFISYGDTQEIGMLSVLDDVKVGGSLPMSPWAFNKAMLDEIKKGGAPFSQDGRAHLRLIVAAGLTEFYVAYYEWFSLADSAEFDLTTKKQQEKNARRRSEDARKSLDELMQK